MLVSVVGTLKASWFVEIYWNWNGSLANEKEAVLGLCFH
jgi:hypothetical protein